MPHGRWTAAKNVLKRFARFVIDFRNGQATNIRKIYSLNREVVARRARKIAKLRAKYSCLTLSTLRRDEIMKRTDKAFGGSYIFSERGKRTSAISNKKETKRFFAKNRQNSEKQQLQLKNTIKKRKKSAQKTTVREIYIKSEYNDMSENSGMFFRKKKNGKRRVAKSNARWVFC